MGEERCRRVCREMTAAVVHQVSEYRKHGFAVVGLVGIDGSPSCGVGTTWREGAELPGRGIFIELLDAALVAGPGTIPMVGIKAAAPGPAVETVRVLLQG
jgi:hypothetical protein